MRKGEFDLEDLSDQLKQMEKLGGMSSMMGMLPGIGKIKKQIDAANLDDSILKRQRAIISSMTPKERRSPKILDGKRKRRIAAGSGTKPEDINRLLKMHRQMADMMKMMGKRGGLMQRMMGDVALVVHVLAAVLGVVDVILFIMGMTQSTGGVTSLAVAAGGIVIAASSNNLAKGVYAYMLSDRKTGVKSLGLLAGLGIVGLAPLVWVL